MTYSIVARDPATGHLGVAVASRFFAVGCLVPHLRGGVGAVATQAFVNPTYGPDGLRLMAAGAPPASVVDIFTGRDDGHPNRQFHLIDAQGRNAAFTGRQMRRLGGPPAGRRRVGRGQHAGRPAGRGPHPARLSGRDGQAAGRTPADRHAGGRGCGRRQARAAVGLRWSSTAIRITHGSTSAPMTMPIR
jgi:hypothetical protein